MKYLIKGLAWNPSPIMLVVMIARAEDREGAVARAGLTILEGEQGDLTASDEVLT